MNDLPTREQLLKDPIREKFVFLTRKNIHRLVLGLQIKQIFMVWFINMVK